MNQLKVGHELDAAIHALLHKVLGLKPPHRTLAEVVEAEGEVPYVFDLFHDIKTMDEINAILAGQPHRSRLGAQELRNFAAEMGYPIDPPGFLPYSTDWNLAGKLADSFDVNLIRKGFGYFETEFPVLACIVSAEQGIEVFESGDTGPEAICRAILAWHAALGLKAAAA